MRLILVGCEYVGTTTLANKIEQWASDNMGARLNDFHSHWKYPHIATGEVSEEDQQLLMQLSPSMKELIVRTNLEYHMHPLLYDMDDHCMVGHYIEEMIYAPLYFGYGGPGGIGDRTLTSRSMERSILRLGPGTTVVHLKATPEDDPAPHEGGPARARRASGCGRRVRAAALPGGVRPGRILQPAGAGHHGRDP